MEKLENTEILEKSGMYSAERQQRHKVTERDMKVPGLLREYKMLTTSQIQRLLYPTLQKAQIRLLRLHEDGLVKRFAYPVLLREGGKGEYVYHLDGKKPKISLSGVQHTLTLNDVRIAFERGCEKQERIRLIAFIPEYEGRKATRDVKGKAGNDGRDGRPGRPWREVEDSVQSSARFGQKVTLIPDAVICLESATRRTRGLFFLEVDMGSEKLLSGTTGNYSLLDKMLRYQDYKTSRGFERYKEMFGFDFKGFRVLTLMNNDNRIQRLRRELTKTGIERFIWFTENTKIDEKRVFDKIWYITDANDEAQYSIIRD